jgi:hypothetical protein
MLNNKILQVKDLSITLTDKQNEDINAICTKFAYEMTTKKQSGSYYISKRNANPDKVKNNISLGKKGEFCTAKILEQTYGFPILDIDVEIRTGRKKGWQTDLPYNLLHPSLYNIHVKTCDKSTVKYCKDFSWTFQFSNRNTDGGTDTLFKGGNNEVIALVYLDDHLSPTCIIKAILPWGELQPLLKDPINPWLNGVKKCIYYQDLLQKIKKGV